MTVKRLRDRWFDNLALTVVVLSLVVLIAALSGPASIRTAEARPNAATITLSPSPATIAGCDTAQVQVVVNDVVNLYGADIRLAFDPAALEVVDANSGKAGIQVLSGGFLVSPFILFDTADNTAGTIRFVATQLNPTPPANGTGALVNILFRAKLSGATPLTFTLTQLSDPNGQAIAATATNGSATATGPTEPTVSIGKLNATDARLSWTASAGVADYRIYRATTPHFTPTDPPYATTTNLSYDDAGVLGNPATNYYYVIKSACANGLVSVSTSPTSRVGEFDFAITRNAYNTIALPLVDAALARADDLGAATGATVVSRWVTTTQSLSSRTVGTSGFNFTLGVGQGYFLYTPGAGPAVFTLVGGVPPAGSVHFSLSRAATCRLNLISLPFDQSAIGNADTLGNAISGVPVISEWRAIIGGFASRTVGVSGPNFATRIGYPYWPCANNSSGGPTWP